MGQVMAWGLRGSGRQGPPTAGGGEEGGEGTGPAPLLSSMCDRGGCAVSFSFVITNKFELVNLQVQNLQTIRTD